MLHLLTRRTSLFITAAVVLAAFAVVLSLPPPVLTAKLSDEAGRSVSGATAESPIQLEARLSHGALLPGDNEVYAQVDLTARTVATSAEGGTRKPVNLALVIDRSGSMHGDKLEKAKAGALNLVDQLRAEDRLTIVHYGGDVETLEGRYATDENKSAMRAFIDNIHDNGDTNIGAALQAAADQLRGSMYEFPVTRLVLISDGEPTSGIIAPDALVAEVTRLREQGFTVSAIGVGTDFNESLMTRMANAGGGFYGFLEDSARLSEVFRRELDQAGNTVGRGLRLTLEVPEGVEVEDVFGQSVPKDARSVEVPLYDLASGQSARVIARLKVTAPKGEGHLPVLKATLRYSDVLNKHAQTVAVQASSQLTHDASQVTALLDKDVEAAGIKALGSQLTARAAVAYEEGRTDEALGLFDNVRRLFGSSADALGGDTRLVNEANTVTALQGSMSHAQGSALNAQVKNIQKKSLTDFGSNNVY